MKNIVRNSLIIITMICILASCANKNYVNTTEIYKDGSCLSTMSLKGDSSILTEQVFPVLIDSSWKKTIEKVNNGDNSFLVKVNKKFENVNDINKETINDSSAWSKLNHSFKLDKKFRWFYSYLSYEETYKKMNPYNLIPVTDYIARDELLLLTGEYTEYLAGRDSSEIEHIKKQIEDKFFAWLQASVFEEFMHTLSENAHLIGNPAITPETIKNKKDTIWKSLQLKTKKNDEFMFEVDSVLTVCSICLNNKDFDKLRPSKSKVFDDYLDKSKKFDLWLNMVVTSDKAKNSVIMPGLLINTNSKTVIGNEIQWEFTPLKCFFNDYEINVTSRVTNSWAFVLSGVFLILLIIGLLVGALIKRRR
jgi:hypothetical protein